MLGKPKWVKVIRTPYGSVKKKDAFRRMKCQADCWVQCSVALNTVSCDCCFCALCGALCVWLCVRENLLIGSDISPDKNKLYTQCSRNTFYCTLFTVHFYCSLFTEHCSMLTYYYTWFTLHCLYMVCCTPFTIHLLLYTVDYTLFTKITKRHSQGVFGGSAPVISGILTSFPTLYTAYSTTLLSK